MRRRQICCMHGGYRGAGVTINWNTTNTNGIPIVEPSPSNPTPSKPSPIDNTASQNLNSKASRIGEIVGLTVSGIGAATLAGLGAYNYYKNRREQANNGIVDEDYPVLNLSPDTDDIEEEYPQREDWTHNDEAMMNRLWDDKVRLAREHDE